MVLQAEPSLLKLQKIGLLASTAAFADNVMGVLVIVRLVVVQDLDEIVWLWLMYQRPIVVLIYPIRSISNDFELITRC